MNAWNPVAVRKFIPALIGWCLALAACLRAEQLRGDRTPGVVARAAGERSRCWS
jgi:protein gp37